MTIIATASQKGGVTKSTCALAIAALLAQRFRVSFVDLDKEAFATTMGLAQDASSAPLEAAPHRIVHPAFVGGELLLFAGGAPMGSADEQSIRRHIRRAAQAAEIVVVDTPPDGQSPAVTEALRAAHLVVAPVTPEFQSVAGMQRLLATAARLNAGAPVRALLSRWDGRTRLAHDVHQHLVATTPGLTVSSIVPRDQRAAEAMAAGCPVPLYSSRSAASAAYRTATYELAALAGLRIPQGAL